MWCKQSFLAISNHAASHQVTLSSTLCRQDQINTIVTSEESRADCHSNFLFFLPCTKLSLFMFSPLLFPFKTFLAHTFPLHSIRSRNNGSHVESTWWRQSMRINFSSGNTKQTFNECEWLGAEFEAWGSPSRDRRANKFFWSSQKIAIQTPETLVFTVLLMIENTCLRGEPLGFPISFCCLFSGRSGWISSARDNPRDKTPPFEAIQSLSVRISLCERRFGLPRSFYCEENPRREEVHSATVKDIAREKVKIWRFKKFVQPIDSVRPSLWMLKVFFWKIFEGYSDQKEFFDVSTRVELRSGRQ